MDVLGYAFLTPLIVLEDAEIVDRALGRRKTSGAGSRLIAEDQSEAVSGPGESQSKGDSEAGSAEGGVRDSEAGSAEGGVRGGSRTS